MLIEMEFLLCHALTQTHMIQCEDPDSILANFTSVL